MRVLRFFGLAALMACEACGSRPHLDHVVVYRATNPPFSLPLRQMVCATVDAKPEWVPYWWGPFHWSEYVYTEREDQCRVVTVPPGCVYKKHGRLYADRVCKGPEIQIQYK